MKKLIGILLLIFSIATFGQFPEPTNFAFSYEYISTSQGGLCAGQWVNGPTYCSHFTWSAPDTNVTNATLEYYKLYYYSYGAQDTSILTTTTDLYFNMEIGIMGEIWVTAMYSDPRGESGPSNVVINDDLPIFVNKHQLQNELTIFYDNKKQEIKIKNGESVSRINIYTCQGEIINSKKSHRNKINIETFPRGLYIIEIIKNNQDVIRQKFIK